MQDGSGHRRGQTGMGAARIRGQTKRQRRIKLYVSTLWILWGTCPGTVDDEYDETSCGILMMVLFVPGTYVRTYIDTAMLAAISYIATYVSWPHGPWVAFLLEAFAMTRRVWRRLTVLSSAPLLYWSGKRPMRAKAAIIARRLRAFPGYCNAVRNRSCTPYSLQST